MITTIIIIIIIIIILIILYFSNVSKSEPNATLPRYRSSDNHQMADDVTTLNDEIPHNATRWENTPVHRMKYHGCADIIHRVPGGMCQTLGGCSLC